MTDVVVLEFLSEHDLELSPKPLYRNLQRHGHNVGYSTIRGRVRELEKQDMLSKDSDGYYEVTNKAQSYLSGDLDASDLE